MLLNGLKTIFARLTTNGQAIGALNEVGIAISDLQGNVRPVDEILGELAGKWDTLTDAERQNVAVKGAGVYQLSRFNALLNNYDLAVKATNSSINSQGSSFREQEKFAESLQARINRLNTAWYSFSATVGEGGLYDSIVLVTSALEGLTGAGEGGLNLLNLFSAILTPIGVGLVLLSTRFNAATLSAYNYARASALATARNLAQNVSQKGLAAGIATTTVATTASAVAAGKAAIATTAFAGAVRTLLLSIGVGAAFLLLGVAIDRVVSAMSEATQASERIQTQLGKNTDALTANKDQVTELITEFKDLTKTKNENAETWNAENETNYLSVQQRLGDLFPALVKGIDATGQSYLLTGNELERQIELTEDLIRLKKEENKANAEDNIAKLIKDRQKIAKDSENLIYQIEDFEKRLANNSITLNTKDGEKQLATFRVALKESEIAAYNASAEITSEIINIAESFATVDISSPIKNQIEDFVRTLDLSELDSSQITEYSKRIGDLATQLEKAFQDKNAAAIDKISKELTEASSSAKNFQTGITNAGITLDSITRAASLTGKGVGTVTEEMSGLGETADAAAEEMEELEKSITFINKTLEDYAENNKLGADSLNEIIKRYPHLIDYINDEDELIKQLTKTRDDDVKYAKKQLADKLVASEGFYKNSFKLVQDFFAQNYSFYQGDLQGFKNLAEAKSAVESELINNLSKKWKVFFDAQNDAFSVFADTQGEFVQSGSSLGFDIETAKRASAANKALQDSRNAFDSFTLDQVQLDFSKIGTTLGDVGKATKAAEKEAKKANETTKESIYVTDEYKKKTEELNVAIAKQQSLRNGYTDYSKEYRKAINEEIKLQEQQLKLTEQQIASLEKQIKTGAIKQTGAISLDNGEPAKTTTTQRNIAGFDGAITSRYRAQESFRRAPHTGIDVAGKRGDRLESNVSGEVVNTGKTSLSGNYVQIVDENGLKHFYGHLDSIAVAVNDIINIGDQIGAIGNTGNVVTSGNKAAGAGSHLHYEIKKNGKNIDPTSFVSQAKSSNKVTSGGSASSVKRAGSGAVDSSQQAVDDAISTLRSLESDRLKQIETIQNLRFDAVQAQVAEYEFLVKSQDEAIKKQDLIQENLFNYTQANEDSVNKQYAAEKRKIALYDQQLSFIQQTLKAGKLTGAQQAELINQSTELQNQTLASENQLKSYYAEVVNGRLARFDKAGQEYQESLVFEQRQLGTLARESSNYNKILKNMTQTRKLEIQELKNELEYSHRILSAGNLSKELYEELAGRIKNLRTEMLDAREALQELNYELIQTNIITADNRIDDIDFNLDYIKAQRELLEEGSGSYRKSLDDELVELNKKLKEIKNRGADIQFELINSELSQDRLLDLEEELESNALAYVAIQKEIKNTTVAIKDFYKEIDDEAKKQRETVADDLISNLKDAIEQAKDIQLAAIDELTKAEEKRHEKVIKNYDQQLESYNDIIEAQRRQLSDSDRDRSFNNTIGDLNTNRQKLLDRRNLLTGVNTYDAVKEREELTEQIAEIDKNIAEERYQYEKTLREQQFDDLLDEKEKSIEDLKKQEDEGNRNTIESIQKQQSYWESYYSDLLNDEKYFAQLKKDIISGNYTEIESRYNEYIGLLKNSLPDLENTFDGTWKAVGTQIRENVIDNLRIMLEEIKKVEAEITKVNTLRSNNSSSLDTVFSDVNKTVENYNSKKDEYSEADLKVILAKFINEQIAGSLDPKNDKSRIANIKEKSYALAAQGRNEGSTIAADTSFSSVVGSISKDKLAQVGDYFQSNAGIAGFSTQSYVDAIREFGSTASAGGLLTTGDKQVLTAKYIREKLIGQADSQAKKDSLRSLTDSLALQGRNNTSLVQASSGYDSAFSRLTAQQQSELGQYILSNSGIVAYPELRDKLTSYGELLKLNYSDSFVGLNTGGMTKNYSGRGVDGKGGKQLLIHPNEIVNNPLDSERLLRTASIMDGLLSRIGGINRTPQLDRGIGGGSQDNSINLTVQIENMSGTKKDVDNLNDQIQKTLLRERGKLRR